MGWWSRIFGVAARAEKKSARHKASGPITFEPIGDHLATIDALDFVGHWSRSPNGRHVLLWRDDWLLNGVRQSGRYLLLSEGQLVVDAAMPRPNDGKVANNGTFILNDWIGRDDLSGAFNAFRADGSLILRRAFSANLYNNGLSPDGRLAVAQTCNAPHSADSSILAVFDLTEARELAAWVPESGWADDYAFPEDPPRIRMLRRGQGPLEYDLDGHFISREAWFEAEVSRGTLHVIRAALTAGETESGVSRAKLREGVSKALRGAERDRADAYRLLGEIEEADGDPLSALSAYEAALALNPKIGVAKRAAALRKIHAF